MDKIYAIFSGEYSDWDVHGFFTNEEDAEKYCIYMNEKRNSYELYYVKEINSIEIAKEIKDIEISKVYGVLFSYKDNGTYAPSEYPIEYWIYDKDVCNKFNKRIDYSTYRHWINFKFVSDSKEKAEKIAEDAMAVIMNEFIQCNDMDKAVEILRGWEKEIY